MMRLSIRTALCTIIVVSLASLLSHVVKVLSVDVVQNEAENTKPFSDLSEEPIKTKISGNVLGTDSKNLIWFLQVSYFFLVYLTL